MKLFRTRPEEEGIEKTSGASVMASPENSEPGRKKLRAFTRPRICAKRFVNRRLGRRRGWKPPFVSLPGITIGRRQGWGVATHRETQYWRGVISGFARESSRCSVARKLCVQSQIGARFEPPQPENPRSKPNRRSFRTVPAGNCAFKANFGGPPKPGTHRIRHSNPIRRSGAEDTAWTSSPGETRSNGPALG